MNYFVLRHFRGFYVTFVLVFLILSCAGVPKSTEGSGGAIAGLKSLDEALSGAVTEIGAKVTPKTEIVVYRISGPVDNANEYISEELNGLLNSMSSLTVLAREDSLNALKAEQLYQMSGLVSDSSMVSIGNHLGAKVVVSGTLSMFEGFTQLRLRAVDVETSALAASYDVRINSADPILKSISGNQIFAANINENALTHLNRGKDLLSVLDFENMRFDQYLTELDKISAELDKIIAEFDKALAINNDLAEAHFLRAQAYYYKYDVYINKMMDEVDELELLQDSFIMSLFEKCIADLNQTTRLNSNYLEAYLLRSQIYTERAMIFEDLANFYYENDDLVTERSYISKAENDYRIALADINQVIQPNSDDYFIFYTRGSISNSLGEFDLAIADYTKAIQLAPDVYWLYSGRGFTYSAIGDYDRAIADYETVLRLNPNYTLVRQQLERIMYYQQHEADASLPQAPVTFPAETALPPQTTTQTAETTQPPQTTAVPAATPPAAPAKANNYLFWVPFAGYNYLYGLPIGFTFGVLFEDILLYDVYASFNLSTDNKIGWSAGFSIAPVPYYEFFWLSAGIGANHIKNNNDEWENKLAIEIGPKLFMFDLFYISAFYRLVGFKESSFSVGAGIYVY